MIILAILIFSFCTWAVFSKHFNDGIVAKNFFSLAAITACLTCLDPHNYFTGLSSVLFLVVGFVYLYYRTRHFKNIKHRPF